MGPSTTRPISASTDGKVPVARREVAGSFRVDRVQVALAEDLAHPEVSGRHDHGVDDPAPAWS